MMLYTMIQHDTTVSYDPCMISSMWCYTDWCTFNQRQLRHCFPYGLLADESLQDLPRPIRMSLSEDPATAQGLKMLLRLLNQ